jgi:hypothetical protein
MQATTNALTSDFFHGDSKKYKVHVAKTIK